MIRNPCGTAARADAIAALGFLAACGSCDMVIPPDDAKEIVLHSPHIRAALGNWSGGEAQPDAAE